MTIFDTMKFPSYSFKEYPKWIKIDGQDVLVNSQREEIAMIATTPEAAKNDPVVEEKNRLAEELSKAQAELAELRALKAEMAAKAKMESDSTPPKPEDTPKGKSVSETLKKG